MKSRLLLLFTVCAVAWLILLGRAARLQMFPDARLAHLKRRQFETALQIHTRRGAITDRNGAELAASVPAYSLFADPKLIETPRSTGSRLAKILDLPAASLIQRLGDKQKRFIWIKRQLSEARRNEIRSWDVPGLAFVEEPRRVYPNGALMSQVLGFVGAEGAGLEGLELQYNHELSGQLKTVILPRDARGRPLLEDARSVTEVPDGADLQLTIDQEAQYALERELVEAVDHFNATGATGVVMDAKTSEVLAAASVPVLDPLKRDRVVTDAFEPGSTMKSFLIAGALRENLVKPGTRYNCEGGRIKVGDKWITEAEAKEKFRWLTVSEILSRSSNVGAAKIGLDLGPEKLSQALRDFGFGQKTGIELPGESRGLIQPLPWRPHLTSNVAFGQGIAVTAIQMAAAYAAIANGGVLNKPRLVKGIRPHGMIMPDDLPPVTVRRVLAPADAATLRLMLINATERGGTGSSARVPGFHVAGKTGTAQKPDPVHGGYLKDAYVSSFAGFVPAHDPRFVIYVAVDHPKKAYYGSQVAAPVFSRIARELIHRAGLSPVIFSESNVMPEQSVADRRRSERQREAFSELKRGDADHPEDRHVFPNLLGLTLREAVARIKGSTNAIDVHGHGVVVRTLPVAGAASPNSKSRVTLVLE